MKTKVWRITKDKYIEVDDKEAFSGDGAFKDGSRWNSERIYMVYTSESISLAILEVLVGGKSISQLNNYVKIPAEFESSDIEELKKLPKDWDSYKHTLETKRIGDEWTISNRSLVLKVPSAVVNEESNFLINPKHPDFGRIKIGKAEMLMIDKRLLNPTY